MGKTSKNSHLSLDERMTIEIRLKEGGSIRSIASELGKSPSTISRELRKHTRVARTKYCDCEHFSTCGVRHACGDPRCRKLCRGCPSAKRDCAYYARHECESLAKKGTHTCNGCGKKGWCKLEKRFYEAGRAEKEYRDVLVNSRNGYDLTGLQLQQINDVVTPLVRRGQSIYHIVQNNRDVLPASESTIRRLISDSELDVRDIDLPEAVKRKPRRKKKGHPAPPVSKAGRLYADYLGYVGRHDVHTVQMDCVEGSKDDKKAILTLHFEPLHMQLAYMMDSHDSANVVKTLDTIEALIGLGLFRKCFPLILTDNGHEFSDIRAMERSISGGERTKIFFCEPNRSDQKGGCENNHKLIRRIIPKGTSISGLTQLDLLKVTNHINSYSRNSLFGRCPYEMAMAFLPDDFFALLGLERIQANDVNMTPGLLSR